MNYILFVCLQFLGMGMGMSSLPKKEIMAYKLMGNFAKKVQGEGLTGRGSGLQEDKSNHKIGVLFVDFKSDKVLDIESARKVAVHNASAFLEYINDNPHIQPHLTISPATHQQIEIMISGQPRSDNNSDYVRMVLLGKGTIAYFTDGIPGKSLIYEETFEEALQKIK